MNSWLLKWYPVSMHVKWFTEDTHWYPLPIAKVITPAFIFWLCFTIIILFIAAILSEPLERVKIVRITHQFLNNLKRFQLSILRIGVGIGLILQLVTGTYLAPSFPADQWPIYALLLMAIIGLLSRKLLIVSGTSLTILYMTAILSYGIFHLLDYMFYIGIIYYLFVANSAKLQRTAAPMLYFCTGLSLAWLAMEKLTIAKLACSLMHEYGLPTFGFTVEDFVLISGFIELGLAWTLIVGLMNRFTAFLLTGIFITTTTVFGFTEIVGHTIMHTILLMFLIEGNESFRTLFKFHRQPVLRYLFVTINFCVLLFAMMAVYIWMGQQSIA